MTALAVPRAGRETSEAAVPKADPLKPAKPEKKSRAAPAMEAVVVRSAAKECQPDCPEWIAAQGMITPETAASFKKVLSRLDGRRLPVLVDSLGGSVPDAYEIGRLIRAKGLSVAVAETEFLPCPGAAEACDRMKSEGVRFGTPHDLNAKCVSACPFLLAAGTRRAVGKNSYVGVHEFASYKTTIRILRKYRVTTTPSFFGPAKQTKTLISEKKVGESTERVATTRRSYDKAKTYFVEMGVSESIMALVHKAPFESIHVLTPDELAATGIATEATPVDEVVKAASKESASPAAAEAKPAPAPVAQQTYAAANKPVPAKASAKSSQRRPSRADRSKL